jgi:hypothetical protein
MLRIILVIIALNVASAASAEKIAGQNFNYRTCNHHNFTFLFFKAYDVYLCTNDKKFLYPQKIFNSDFSLIINYNMNFDRSDLASSSIEEIKRYYTIDQEDQNNYYKQLFSIFPNIKKGDVIEAKYNQKGRINFYHNKLLTGVIEGRKFSEIFLNIWLHKDNKYQNMTKDLFLIK